MALQAPTEFVYIIDDDVCVHATYMATHMQHITNTHPTYMHHTSIHANPTYEAYCSIVKS